MGSEGAAFQPLNIYAGPNKRSIRIAMGVGFARLSQAIRDGNVVGALGGHPRVLQILL